MRIVGLFVLLFVFTGVQGQNIVKSLEREMPGQGKVTVYQDPAVSALLGQEATSTDEPRVIKAAGYRVQVYAGNNSRNARNEAYGVAGRVKEYFPEMKIYTSFTSPRWLCQVGDFRSIEEADAMLRKLKGTGSFKEVSIVKAQINITL